MQKQIRGLTYNTNKAKKIAELWHGHENNDNYFKEILYKKRTGEYFLYHDSANGQSIKPLTFEKAKRWVVKHADAWNKDIYQQEFGKLTASKSEKKIQAYSLSLYAIEKLNRMASKQKISKSEIIEKLIRNS